MLEHYIIFAWEIILRESTKFLVEGWVEKSLLVNLREEYNILIKSAASKVNHIIESFNIPIQAVYSPIAKDYILYNEKSY